jgi:hypothetical protein
MATSSMPGTKKRRFAIKTLFKEQIAYLVGGYRGSAKNVTWLLKK